MTGVIGQSLRSTAAQKSWWHERLAALDFDPQSNFITPIAARANPRTAIRARLAILLATYRDDYHTDSFDIARLCRRVEQGEEAIAFWGDPTSIDRLRRWLDPQSPDPSDDQLAELELGTATLLDAAAEIGAGHRELCRGGSTSRTVPAMGAIISSLLQPQAVVEGRNGFHTVISVVRNRRSQPGVAGGAAVHRLYTRELKSSFWGFAPWYVMQGGALELLDYREIYSDSDAVRSAILATQELHVADSDEATFVTDLLELNLGASTPAPAVVSSAAAQAETAAWQLTGHPHDELIAYNHITVIPVSEDGVTLEELLALTSARNAACVAARLPLSVDYIHSQLQLAKYGFRLTAISPPKSIGPESVFHGFWSRPRRGLDLAEPYYVNSRLLDPAERRIVAHTGRAVDAWSSSSNLHT